MAHKRYLYRVLIDRLRIAFNGGTYFESAWYSYAVLEDRLCSLLRLSGGDTYASGKAIQMMGPKLKELKARRLSDATLAAVFTDDLQDRLNNWKNNRNSLMHAMANAVMPIEDIDALAKKIAEQGNTLVRDYCSACYRLKKQIKKSVQP